MSVELTRLIVPFLITLGQQARQAFGRPKK